jgi:preprotein translocase subunit SecF
VTRFGAVEDYEFVIRAPLAEDATITEVAATVESQLRSALGDVAFEVDRTELVGAKVGAELQQKALFAILFSMLLTLIYLAFRFELRFGLAAVIATAHDILITLGFLAVFRVEIALPTVAAILTILGYSLNDTIVVFDRIRENRQRFYGEPLESIVNHSMVQTIGRSITTSLTLLVTLVALLLFGGEAIRPFILALLIGVIAGTYSSIFVASPLFLDWHLWADRRKASQPVEAKAERSAA